ncbi:tRNA (cytidine(34)-2'-O)-methyltransferase [Alkaliphilus peptidifermentans]|uniref:Putative tRNA (cytidine(34)-2'-O)-methyltransferase n=1 Tax=Alkaliphilus peptidifermentans DSM 18978 TaxID=1120976 RepID=A0A1G5K123_9FIRM|nr:tRNA (cytidine(34)-2'-O)-methyltransferase [Alkaliphilus peptidifermentans]SCY94297.1 tRNA (cytidine/uridine-2'-O-)-methyltransferase [Alkaliphilus peptidifermentans DSM 18978]
MLNIVLHEPEIPQNTGNIARTCVITNTVLHIIGPTGFSMEEKHLKRAGLDYWHLLDLRYYDNYETFLEKNQGAIIYYATTKAINNYSDVIYDDNCYIMFGKETAGIPKDILNLNDNKCIRIPMLNIEKARSLNLSNSVAIVLYEALRQLDFPGMR